MMIIFSILILLVIMVNGWTDAPNAIAGCVSTRAMTPRGALVLASLSNFVGAVAMAILSPKVAKTLFNIVDFGSNSRTAMASLCAGLCAVIIWATVAWRFGLPTSESHALISGITGAALANRMSIEAINKKEWLLVILGLAFTTIPPFIIGFLFNKLLQSLLKNMERRRIMQYFFRAQRIGAASGALLHGAQDSQKFMGIYMLGLSLSGISLGNSEKIPMAVVIMCAAVMTLGTMLGGSRIIKKVGCDMTELDAVGGSSADAASSAVLLLCSFMGIPASTTHSKACAIVGTGLCKKGSIDVRIVGQMILAWLLTFPICAAIGFILSYLLSLCPN